MRHAGVDAFVAARDDDFRGILRKPNLSQEIDAIEDKVAPTTWRAITAIRKVGAIGAHMEQDINLIIDVDPGEAQTLIGLIEMLLEDWYVDRHDRAERVEAVIGVAETKADAKSGSSPAAAEATEKE